MEHQACTRGRGPADPGESSKVGLALLARLVGLADVEVEDVHRAHAAAVLGVTTRGDGESLRPASLSCADELRCQASDTMDGRLFGGWLRPNVLRGRQKNNR